jgi:hypothetical protein
LLETFSGPLKLCATQAHVYLGSMPMHVIRKAMHGDAWQVLTEII